jgi:hypothetical protein
MAMTLPQRRAPADAAFDVSHFPELEIADAHDRGPANAIITRLAQAIAEQNASNQTEPATSESLGLGFSKLQSLLALALGSATLWVAIILAIAALV